MPLCPICSEAVEESDYREIYISPYNKQEYKRYECPSCDVHWWEPMKIIPEFYESEIFEGYAGFHSGMRLRLNGNHKAFFNFFPRKMKGKLLDIGCGDGVFMRYAKEAGFDVYGIDFDEKSVKIAKSNLKIETIYHMSLEEFFDYAREKFLYFDVITFFEVLEHQDNPRKFLSIVKCLLKQNGLIAGSVPNRESIFQKELHQKDSYVDFPPHHFLRFSSNSLRKTLLLNGFTDVRVHKLDFTLPDVFPFIERKFFKNFDKMKRKVKEKALEEKSYLSSVVAVEDINKISNKKVFPLLVRFLKITRNMLLLPFALPYLTKLKGNGTNIYFQARNG